MKKGLNKKGGTYSINFYIGVVIAIGCILLLLYLGAQLYGTFQRKTDLQQAEIESEKIMKAIEKLEEGESKKVLIEGPEDWSLISKDLDSPYSEYVDDVVYVWDFPTKCGETTCLCFCPRGFVEGVFLTECKIGLCEIREDIISNPPLESEIFGLPKEISHAFSFAGYLTIYQVF